MTKKEYKYIQSKLDEELNKDRNYKFLAGKYTQEKLCEELVLSLKDVIRNIYFSKYTLIPSPQMVAEADCDGYCNRCSGRDICWRSK